MILNKDNYFELLGVDENATERDIRLAYTKVLRQYPHEQFPEEFQWINEAKETLLDPVKREKYVRELKNDGAYDRLLSEAITYVNTEKYNLAKISITELLKLGYENDPEVLILAADIARKLKNFPEERRYIQNLEKNFAHLLNVKRHLRYFYDLEENYTKAIFYAKQLVEENPNDLQHVVFLIDLYMANDQNEQAQRIIKQRMTNFDFKIQDFPILERSLFIAVNNEDRGFANEVIKELKKIAVTNHKWDLLNSLVDAAADIPSDKYIFKFLVLLIEDINNNEFDDVKEWTIRAKNMIIPNLAYFELDERKQNKMAPPQQKSEPIYTAPVREAKETGTPVIQGSEKSDVRGSLIWAIIFGIIFALGSDNLFTGIIVGLVWYFFGGFVKGLIGCLIWLVIIAGILGFIFG